MIRIVLIGNGFDKAHDLPTGYSDFLHHLIDSIARFEETGRGSLKLLIGGRKCGKNAGYFHKLTKEGEKDPWIGVRQEQNQSNFNLVTNPHNNSVYFKSLFEAREKLGYWSDLESHYFQTLYKNKDSVKNIELINKEFEHLKNLLSDYLKTEVEDKIDLYRDYSKYHSSSILSLLEPSYRGFQFEKNYFVSFNYTSKILDSFVKSLKTSEQIEKYPLPPIHVHGTLTSTANPIIFGYGDENSNEYKDLELLINNQLLTNFKTFQYSRTSRYKEVLGLLEDRNDIYVQLIGHSSGLCDKALLRTIFQHDNVKYIESTFHKDESKYFENLYNISRIFDDNSLMREKIIPLNKTSKI